MVDFDGGGRLPVELTDVDAADVAVGSRVEMTFRRLVTADGIHNYFWKARPVRTGATETGAEWDRTASRTGWPSSAMGCTRFAEHWDKGVDDLLLDATGEAFASAGVTRTTSTPTGWARPSRA